jgi:hypothetical protein
MSASQIVQCEAEDGEAIARLRTKETFKAESSLEGYCPEDHHRVEAWKHERAQEAVSRRHFGTVKDKSNDDDDDDGEYLNFLISKEIFPPHLDFDEDKLEMGAWWTTATAYDGDDSPDFSIKDMDDATDQKQPFKTRMKPSKKRKSDHITIHVPITMDEVAECVLKSMQRRVISLQPSLFSLLRAWVLQDSPHQHYCKAQRLSLLDYARMAAQKSHNDNSSNRQPISWSSLATVNDAPPIDILGWFNIPLLNGWKPYPYSQHDHLCQWNCRNSRCNLHKTLHQRNVRFAKRALPRKGINLQTTVVDGTKKTQKRGGQKAKRMN